MVVLVATNYDALWSTLQVVVHVVHFTKYTTAATRAKILKGRWSRPR